MKEILKFLIEHLAFLFEKQGFNFIESKISESHSGDAYLILQSGDVAIRIVKDRGQYFIDFANVNLTKKYKWYSIDLFVSLLKRHFPNNIHSINELSMPSLNAFMNKDNAMFIEKNITEIRNLLSDERINDTKLELKKLQKIRADKIFG